MAGSLSDRSYDDLTATELLLRYHVYLEQFRPEEHARLRDALERAVMREPDHADAWAALSRLYEHEYSHGLNTRPEALERARQAAERGIELNPLSQPAWESMSSVYFFARDLAALRAAGERTIALNPPNASAVAWIAMTHAWAGDYERGVELVRRVMSYNIHHARWFHFLAQGGSKCLFMQHSEGRLDHAERSGLGGCSPCRLLVICLPGVETTRCCSR